MRLHLISPTHYARDGSLHKTTRYWTSAITLPYLKALTPAPHEVSFTDELMHDLDMARVEREADVVGITAMGPQIRRAYDLADHFRGRGKKVVMGGTWVTLAAEDSLRHADAVVAGEAEYVWADVLADLDAGRSRGIYRAPRWHDLRDLPAFDYESLPLLKRDAFRSSWLYRMYFFWPIFFSRGCPHPCEYCAIQTYYGRTYRTRPVDDVIADVRRLRTLGARRLLFLDDNPVARPEEAKELFRRLIPERVQWVSQSTINVARDPELLDLVARSGARVLSIGFESLSEESLESVGKGFNRPSRFAEDIRKLRAKGIQVIALVIVGPRRRYDRHLPRDAPLARGEQDQLPEALHAGALPGDEVPRRHAGGGPHHERRLGCLRLRERQRAAAQHDAGRDARRLPHRLLRLLLGPEHAPPLHAAPAAERPRVAGHAGRERQGNELPTAESRVLGNDQLASAASGPQLS
jgi:hypothetical protein